MVALPTVMRCKINGIIIEECHGPIPDVYRSLWFGPLTEFELPSHQESDTNFNKWLNLYRTADLIGEKNESTKYN